MWGIAHQQRSLGWGIRITQDSYRLINNDLARLGMRWLSNHKRKYERYDAAFRYYKFHLEAWEKACDENENLNFPFIDFKCPQLPDDLEQLLTETYDCPDRVNVDHWAFNTCVRDKEWKEREMLKAFEKKTYMPGGWAGNR